MDARIRNSRRRAKEKTAAMIELSIYGAIAVSRVAMQVGTSVVERKKIYKGGSELMRPAALIVAVYNEEIPLLRRALVSFKQLDYPKLQIIVSDDGSDNAREIEEATNKLGFTYIHAKHGGKRRAMYNAFKHLDNDVEIVLTADSDTVWHKDAAKEMVKVLMSDNRIGAVTGEVRVLNGRTNLLTRLIAIRYHLAFAHERASQSYFKSVGCVSGPLGAYRRDIIEKIQHRFINQTFLGKECTYGDDRHLTNLVLNEGYGVKYADNARCYTDVPAKFQQLVKQQTRWSKSYWREILWQIRVLPKHSPYMTLDWFINLVLPFILVFTASSYIAQALGGSLSHALVLLAMIIGMSWLRIAEPLIRTYNPLFLLFTIYSFMYFAVMLPSKLWALVTISDGKWGTR